MGKIPLEQEMATHSSTLAWEIPWTEEPDGLQSVGLQESDTVTKTTMLCVYLKLLKMAILFSKVAVLLAFQLRCKSIPVTPHSHQHAGIYHVSIFLSCYSSIFFVKHLFNHLATVSCLLMVEFLQFFMYSRYRSLSNTCTINLFN